MSKNPLVEGVDYYINKQGLLVFTEAYHLKRGQCCQSGCHHCPYNYTKIADPNIPAEFGSLWSEGELDFEDSDVEDDD